VAGSSIIGAVDAVAAAAVLTEAKGLMGDALIPELAKGFAIRSKEENGFDDALAGVPV
jgi:putative effector of murein hydrolase